MEGLALKSGGGVRQHDLRQTSIVVEYLRPSNVSEQQKLDPDFSALMKVHYDPRLLEPKKFALAVYIKINKPNRKSNLLLFDL